MAYYLHEHGKGTLYELDGDLLRGSARQVQSLAEREGREVSEVLEQSFLAYRAKELDSLAKAYRDAAPPTTYTEEDVPRLLAEVRREMREEGLKELAHHG